MDRLKGKVAIITGAAMGLGAADARLFAAEGAKVVVTDIADKEGLALAEEIGGHFMHQDVRDETRWSEVIDETVERYGKLDILVNNAGAGATSIGRPAIVDATNEQWQALMSVNFWGPVWLCRALVPHMRKAPRSASAASSQLDGDVGLICPDKLVLQCNPTIGRRSDDR